MRRDLLLGPPSWVLPGASLDIDFVHNRAWCQIGGQQPISNLISCSRASSEYVTMASGLLVPVGANVLARSDLGLAVWQGSTNLALQSSSFDVSATWIPTASGVASIPVVTADAGTAPDGTQTADRIQFALNGGTTTTDWSFLRQAITVSAATAYTASIWLKSNTASSYAMQIEDNNGTGIAKITVTPTWQRFSFSETTGGTGATYRLEIRGGQTPANSNSADILAWGAQWELGSFMTPNIPTTTSAVTRAADVATLQGAALTAALNAKAARFVTNAVAGTAIVSAMFGTSAAGHLVFSNSTSVEIDNNGVNSATATIGSAGTYGGLVKSAFSFDSASMTAIANSGTKAITANAWPANPTSANIGSYVGGIRQLNGYMLRASFSANKGQFDTLTA